MSVQDRAGARARVYERYPGSQIQVSIWVPGQGLKRSSLGHKDRSRAVREARTLLTFRPTRGEVINAVTLGQVMDAYLAQAEFHDDGTTKAWSYLADCRRRAGMLCQFLGRETPAECIGPRVVREYVIGRRAGKIGGRTVRTQSITADLAVLRAALRWATTRESGDGGPLLPRNPLAGFKIPKERSPRRPLLTDEEVARLFEVAPQLPNLFAPLLLLIVTTGRRLSSILGLRWVDLDFAKGTIAWRAALDKKRRDWLSPIPEQAIKQLKDLRKERAAIGHALLFPSSRDTEVPVSRHTAANWMRRALRLAKVEKPDGSLWHCLRRKWATERKHLPLPDVLAAGGWSSPEAYQRCYALPTMEGMRSVLDLRGGKRDAATLVPKSSP